MNEPTHTEAKQVTMKPKVLHLTLKKKWFDMIASGEKVEEYREIKPYWIDRLLAPKTPSYSLWEEPGAYDEFVRDAKFPIERFRSSEEVLGYFSVKPMTFEVVQFRNGYTKAAPTIIVECLSISIGRSKLEWGGDNQFCFVIKLGKIISTKNLLQGI